MLDTTFNTSGTRAASRLCALLALIIGAVGLAGWIFEIPALQRLHASLVTMKANTAMALMLVSISLLLQQDEKSIGVKERLAQGLAALVALLGTLTLAEILFGWDLGIDQCWFHESLASAGPSFPGRMGVASAVVFIFLGIALMFLDTRLAGKYWASKLAVAAAVATMLVFLYYFFGVERGESVSKYVTIALHTTVAFYALCVGILFVRPNRGVMRALLSPSVGSVVARRMLPPAFVLPILLGWLFISGENAGLYGPGFGTAVFVLLIIMCFTGLIGWTVIEINRQETERHHAEAESRAAAAAQARLAAIVMSCNDAVLSKSLEGIITSWNPGAERIFGYTAEEMIGQPVMRLIPPELTDEESQILARLKAGKPIDHYQTERVTKDGKRLPVSLTISPIYDPMGKVIGASKIVRDITELKQAEEALREAKKRAEAASQAKDDFLAALSHELRTPLTPVLMVATALENDATLPEETLGQIAVLRRNIELEARLIDDLLDLTRISHGKLTIAPVVADVHEVLHHAGEVVRSDSLVQELSIVFHPDAVRHHARADPTRLQQVFWNLLKNAVKFTPPGGKITVNTSNDESGRIIVSVVDTGMGIGSGALPHIFTAFEQGAATGQHRFGGLGLGLAISQAIVTAHGGKIHAESEGLGLGATFTVVLDTVEPPVASTPNQPKSASPVRALRLLVVEDHETTRTVLTQLLTRRGHQVTPAANVHEALAAYGAAIFDVVISDLGLPDGSGLDLMREIQRQRPVPAIALSGYGMDGDLRRTQEAGFNAHLVKPVKIDQLRRLIEQVALGTATETAT